MYTSKIVDIATYDFGGVIPILNHINKCDLPDMINNHLGRRPTQSTYQHSDIFVGWAITQFCHGFRFRRLTDTKEKLDIIPDFNIISKYAFSKYLKKHSTDPETVYYTNPKNKKDGEKKYVVCENEKMNELLILSLIQMGVLKRGQRYTLDIDATALISEVLEASKTYKRHLGFMPMVCMIGKVVVYISMRSGNANPHFAKKECLEKCIDLLEKFDIGVDKVRIDGAGYKNEVLDYLESKRIDFVVGANWSVRTQHFFNNVVWEKRSVNTTNHVWDAEIASTYFNLSKSKYQYNMCAIRVKQDKEIKDDDLPTKWKLYDGYYYKFILTKNIINKPFDVINEYHQRGTFEVNFDILKNDFGWRILPFSRLHHNLTYLQITAFASNLFETLRTYFSDKLEGKIEPNIRLEAFFRAFIDAAFSFSNGVFEFHMKYGKPPTFASLI